VQHLSDDTLEQFAAQTFPESELGPMEEHLMTCPNCLERLQAEIEFVPAMRDGAVTIREAERS
jgi:hypothetical protein